MDRMFDTYAALLSPLREHLIQAHPKPKGVSDVAYRQSVRAQALDALRGLLPAGALSNVGIYGSGQSYELLVMRMRAHRLPEVRAYAELIVDELRKVIPSFLTRLDRPERGGAWVDYLAGRDPAVRTAIERAGIEGTGIERSGIERSGIERAGIEGPLSGGGPSGAAHPADLGAYVDLVDFDPAGEDKVLAAIVYPLVQESERNVGSIVAALGPNEREEILSAYVGDRRNRRHRPGRAFERTSYRFDIVSDYGAFRDLQRHRMLTIDWQPLGTSLGWSVPHIVREAGLESPFAESLERSGALAGAIADEFPLQATYAVALAYNIRYSMQMSAREAMHVLELRSGPQGHPSYRQVVQAMHRQIDEIACHHAIAKTMKFVDHSGDELGRLEAEQRSVMRQETLTESTLDGTALHGHE